MRGAVSVKFCSPCAGWVAVAEYFNMLTGKPPSRSISAFAAPMPTPGSSRLPAVPRSRRGAAPPGGAQPSERIACGSSTAAECATESKPLSYVRARP